MRHVKNIVSYLAFVALVTSCTTEPLIAGSGSGWGGFAGGMIGGTMLGTAIASSNRPREVVYVQDNPRRNYDAEEDAYQAGLAAGRRQALAERKQKQAKGKKKTAAPAVVETNEEEMDLNEEA